MSKVARVSRKYSSMPKGGFEGPPPKSLMDIEADTRCVIFIRAGKVMMGQAVSKTLMNELRGAKFAFKITPFGALQLTPNLFHRFSGQVSISCKNLDNRILAVFLAAFRDRGHQQTLTFNFSGTRSNLSMMLERILDLQSINGVNLVLNVQFTKSDSRFGRVLQRLTCLKQLDMYSNDVTEVGMDVFSKAMPTLRSLQAIDLTSNFLNEDAMMDLAKGLRHLDNLVILKIGGNSITDRDAPIFAAAFSRMRSLRELDINGYKLSMQGLQILVSSLPYLRKLEVLDMSCCEQYPNIDARFQVITNILPRMPSLRQLLLLEMKISDQGVEDLIAVLPFLVNLKFLGVGAVSATGFRHLQDQGRIRNIEISDDIPNDSEVTL